MDTASSKDLLTNEAPTDRVRLGAYATASGVEQARSRLRTAGLWAVIEPVPASVVDGKDSAHPESSEQTAGGVLCIRARDERKARGILSALHRMPEEEVSNRSPSSHAPTDGHVSAQLEDSQAIDGVPGISDTDTAHSDVSDDDADDATNDAAEENSTSEWMAHVRFSHMVIGGAVILALATVLFFWMQAGG